MAQYKRQHHPIIDGELESFRLRRDMFDGNEDATYIRSYAVSGTLDPFTEEVTYHEDIIRHPMSGIVQTIKEGDMLIGVNGRIRVGDTMVLYHYDTVSGVHLTQQIDEVELAVPGVSGVYQVKYQKVETLGQRPIFLKVVLQLDANE